MALTGLTTFVGKAKLLAAQLNNMKTVLEAKFNGGIGGADLGWPFTANGNLNMNGNQILRVSRFRNVYNLAEYTSDIQGLFTTVGAAGGGAIYVPANTTIDLSGVTYTGAYLHLYGQGPTSVLRMAGGSVVDMLRLNVTSSLLIENLRFDGNNVGSATKALLRLSTCTNFRVQSVEFINSAGAGVLLDYQTAAGTSCNNAMFDNCYFTGNNVGDSVRIEDARNIWFNMCNWDTNTKTAINVAPPSASSVTKNINVRDSLFHQTASVPVIQFRDSAAAAAVSGQVMMTVRDCTFEIAMSANRAMVEGWYLDNFSFENNYISFTGSTTPCVYLRKSHYINISNNTWATTSADAICIGHLGSNDATTITDGCSEITINGNIGGSIGGRLAVLGYPKMFTVMGNSVRVGNAAAFAGNVSMIALWSLPNGNAADQFLMGRVCYNSCYNSYYDVLEATQVGHAGAAANIGQNAAFRSRFVCIGNINQGRACSAAAGLTNNTDVRDTLLGAQCINEHNVGA